MLFILDFFCPDFRKKNLQFIHKAMTTILENLVASWNISHANTTVYTACSVLVLIVVNTMVQVDSFTIKVMLYVCLFQMKDDAVALVDVFAPTDFILNSPIGNADGQVRHTHWNNTSIRAHWCIALWLYIISQYHRYICIGGYLICANIVFLFSKVM